MNDSIDIIKSYFPGTQMTPPDMWERQLKPYTPDQIRAACERLRMQTDTTKASMSKLFKLAAEVREQSLDVAKRVKLSSITTLQRRIILEDCPLHVLMQLLAYSLPQTHEFRNGIQAILAALEHSHPDAIDRMFMDGMNLQVIEEDETTGSYRAVRPKSK